MLLGVLSRMAATFGSPAATASRVAESKYAEATMLNTLPSKEWAPARILIADSIS